MNDSDIFTFTEVLWQEGRDKGAPTAIFFRNVKQNKSLL
jgi:hypothetical protein